MGSRTEKLLLEDAEEYGYSGIKVDMGGHGGYKTGHDAGDIILGRSAKMLLSDVEPSDDAPMQVVGKPEEHEVSDLYIIEEKYKSTDANKYLQEPGEKFDAMIEFAEAIGATPLLACRWSTQLDWSPGATHFIIDARDVERTKSGNVSVKPETAETKFESTEEFFG
jgi:Holliday junction resolvase